MKSSEVLVSMRLDHILQHQDPVCGLRFGGWRLNSWPCDGVRTTWSCTLWRWAPHHHQHCVCSGNLQVSQIYNHLKWASNTDTDIKKAQHMMYFLFQLRKLNLPQELLIQYYTAVILFSVHPSLSDLDWPPNRTRMDYNRQSGLQAALNLGLVYSGIRQETSLQIHHPVLLSGRHCRALPAKSDPRTVSTHRPSLWWTAPSVTHCQ